MIRTAWRAGMALLVVLLCVRLGLFVVNGVAAVRFPYQLDYGEGIVWQQALLMFTPAAYGPIDRLPAIVFHYTPVYHVTVRLIAWLTGGDMLAVGRTVSVSGAIAAAIAAALLARRAVPAAEPVWLRNVVATVAGTLLLCQPALLVWSRYMRVDLLAVAFSLWGLLLGLQAVQRPRFVYGAALCFLLAVFTKQTSIAAPAAYFIWLGLVRPRVAVRGVAACLVLGSAVLLLLSLATDWRFMRHVFAYNVNRMHWQQLVGVARLALLLAPVLAVVVVECAARLRALHRASGAWQIARIRAVLDADPAASAFALLTLYGIVTTPMLLMLAKVGAADNYYIEWLSVVTILTSTTLPHVVRLGAMTSESHAAASRRALAALSLVALVLLAGRGGRSEWATLQTIRRTAPSDTLVARLRATSAPVISDDMVLLLRAGKRVEVEPAIVAELGALGTWDQRPYIARIRDGRYAMIITEGPPDASLFRDRYTPAVRAAIAAAYPRMERMGDYTVRLPR